MTDYVDITGVKEGVLGNSVPLRLEIRELIQNKDLLNLYLLGLQRMQALPKTDKLSWYQIAGIHGRPYIAWDNVKGIPGNNAGYCTHSSILFLTWHRPYLALFEQALYANVKAAVAAFPAGPVKDKFTRLVPSFRIPYWDFAADPSLPDIIVRDEQVEIETAAGRQKIKNPLYSYNFGTIDRNHFPASDAPFNTWVNTLRWPARNPRGPTPNDKSQPDEVIRSMVTQASRRGGPSSLNLRDRMFALLSKNGYTNYKAFSNDGWNRNGRVDDYDSLESVHNSIHSWIGGIGHMSNPGYAAFDPVFWLHHCNVDRVFAMWQVLNPNSYVTDQVANWSTFWSNGARESNNPTTEGANTDLLPFHKNDREYYKSNTIKDLKQFGSTYPELIDWGVVTPTQVRANVVAAVQRLYGATSPGSRILGNQSANVVASGFAPAKVGAAQQNIAIPQTDGPGDEHSHGGHKHGHSHPHPHPHPHHHKQEPYKSIAEGGHPSLLEDNHYHEYFADVRVEKYALEGSFNVHFFMGEYDSDPVNRVYDGNLVGTFSIFANNPNTTGCGKCKSDAKDGMIVSASIPLTGALLDRIPDNSIPELQSLEPDTVVPFLNKQLHWRINKCDGTAVSRDEVPSLKVAVVSAIVDLPDNENELPAYRDWAPLYGVTAGRRCGIEEGDDL